MDKLSFCDLVVLAKSINIDFDKLLYQNADGYLSSPSGFIYERDSDAGVSAECVSAECASDNAYDKLFVLIKVLKGIYDNRPLPF